MADAPLSIFNKKATEKLRSPDDLDKYVRVTNPSVWAVLAACIALLLGLLAWAVFGTVSTGVNTSGTVVETVPMCFLTEEDVVKVHRGDSVTMGAATVKVSGIGGTPLSRDEAATILQSDYLASAIIPSDWSYLVIFEGDVSGLNQGVPIPVVITTQRVAPISLILGNSV